MVTLSEEEVEVFSVYATWLYTNNFCILDNESRAQCRLLTKAYVFGEKVIDNAFKDAIIDSIVVSARVTRTFPGHLAVARIYDGTPPGSPARKLMVDMHVWDGHAGWIDLENLEIFNKEFLADLSVALLTQRSKPTSKTPYDVKNSCAYHSHGKDESCSLSK